MDLPTYTNIWRIEKRLYKLYDFRLPVPLPITSIAVFTGVTVPFVLFLVIAGVPFDHTLAWLYVLPPGVLTWLITRPVVESKRLPELVGSQLRYLVEPRAWCRMAPFAEKEETVVSVRVWRRSPSRRRPQAARQDRRRGKRAGRLKLRDPAPPSAGVPARASSGPAVPAGQGSAAGSLPASSSPGTYGEPLPAAAQPSGGLARVRRTAHPQRPGDQAAPPDPAVAGRPVSDPPYQERYAGMPHRPGPSARGFSREPGQGAPGLVTAGPAEPAEPPEADRVAAGFATASSAAAAPVQSPAAGPAADPSAAALFDAPPGDRSAPEGARPRRHRRGPVPDSGFIQPPLVASVRTRQPRDPAVRDLGTLAGDRSRMPPAGSCVVAVLGCAKGVGQSVTALMAGHALAAGRDVPVALLDLNPGTAPWGTRMPPAVPVTALLTGEEAGPAVADALSLPRPGQSGAASREPGPAVTLFTGESSRGRHARSLGPDDYQALTQLLAGRYPLVILDPASREVPHVLPLISHLVLVVPAHPSAADMLTGARQWLAAHGYGHLAAEATTVINGVGRQASRQVPQIESAGRGRSRVVVPVPWDDLLTAGPDSLASLHPRTRQAYITLAGGLAVDLGPAPAVRSRSEQLG